MSGASAVRREGLRPFEKSATTGVRPGTRILIVDDEHDLLDMLTAYFLASKYDVDTATNGVEALAAVSQQRPDVVLLDIHMPEMNGIDALREIMKVDQSIGVIMVTGNTQLSITVEAIRNGAFGYIPKPFDFRYLDHLIAACLTRCRPRR
jgi:DNA-binding response OmpR family regulator